MSGVVALIVNYESGDRLRRCLASLLAQAPPPDRVIVVDNGSADGSADDLPDGVERLDLPNPGFGAAVRAGMAASNEPWVLTLNPDLELAPGCLAAATDALGTDHVAGSVAMTVVQSHDRERLDATGISLTSRCGQLNRGHGLPIAIAADTPSEVLGPLGGAALWRRRALERAGGFDTRFFLYWEDMDLALRLDRVGYPCRYVPGAVVFHEGSAITGRWSRLNVFYMVRNHWLCLVGSLPGRVLVGHGLQVALAPVRAAVLYALRGRPGAALAGLICGAALVPGALWRRRFLPRTGSGERAAQRIERLMAAADRDRLSMKAQAPPLAASSAP